MVVRPRCRARVGSCQYYEARSLFGGRASPVSGDYACLSLDRELLFYLIWFLISSSFLSGSYHVFFCALRRGIIAQLDMGLGLLVGAFLWLLWRSPFYDYPAVLGHFHYLL